MHTHRTARPLQWLLLGLLLTCMATSTSATTVSIVSGNTTPASYNNSIGDLGAPTGNLPWFPAPNTLGGTQNEIFSTAPDLSTATTTLGNWLADPANLNNNWAAVSVVPANWAVNQEVAIVYSFDAGLGLQDITASFGNIDNGIHIWVDGNWKFGARDPEGRAWTNIALGNVGSGTHYIQILLEDSGGATWYSNPSISATAVPLPAAAWLFGSGVVGLIGIARTPERILIFSKTVLRGRSRL